MPIPIIINITAQAPHRVHVGLGEISSQQTQNICITFIQCWTLYKCYTNVLCLLGLFLSRKESPVSAAVIVAWPKEYFTWFSCHGSWPSAGLVLSQHLNRWLNIITDLVSNDFFCPHHGLLDSTCALWGYLNMDDTFDRCCFAAGPPSTLAQHRIIVEPTGLCII